MENINAQQNAIPVGESGMNVYQKLMVIQAELKAPKSQYNSFGKYNYRSAEGILEALKPLLMKYNATVVLEDVIENNGLNLLHTADGGKKELPNNYIRAIAHFIDVETGYEITTSALARECEHKGMTPDQCTGTASSYARKYCLNGLFLLDDTKDADTDEVQRMARNENANNGQQAQQNAGQKQGGNFNGGSRQNTGQRNNGNQQSGNSGGQQRSSSGWSKKPDGSQQGNNQPPNDTGRKWGSKA